MVGVILMWALKKYVALDSGYTLQIQSRRTKYASVVMSKYANLINSLSCYLFIEPIAIL